MTRTFFNIDPVTRLTLVLSLTILLSSCPQSGNLNVSTPKESASAMSEDPATMAEAEPEAGGSDVEIVWQVPDDPVDSFKLFYGYSADAVDSEVTVAISDLDEIEDPVYGKVYRYVLQGVLPEQSVFVAIAAVKNGVASNRSDVFEIEALAE